MKRNWFIVGIFLILVITNTVNASSIQKTADGLVFGDQINCILGNQINDHWMVRGGSYSACASQGVTASTNFEIELNKPDTYTQIFRLVISTNSDAFVIKTRYTIGGSYYKYDISTAGAVNLYKCTPSCSASLASGTISPYSGDVSILFNSTGSSSVVLSAYESDGTQILTYTDSSSPIGAGTIRLASNTGILRYFYQPNSNTVTVNNLGSNRALICNNSDALIASDSSGAIDLTGILPPVTGYLAITSSGTSCTTNVLAKIKSFEIIGGDTFYYTSSHDLYIGPRVGNVTASAAKIWAKFFPDANGKTMKVQYKTSASSWPDSSCSSNCVASSGTLSSSNDYIDVVEITGLSAQTTYDCRIYLDSTVQSSSQCSFTTTVSSGDTTLKIAFAACLCTIKRPYDVFDAVNSLAPDLFILLGDNIYEECPFMLDDVSTYSSGATRVAGYRLKYDDVFSERKYNDFMQRHSVLGTIDDHEIDADYDQGTGTSIYADTISVYDDYIMDANPTALVSGKRYWKKSIGNTDIYVLDLISHRDTVASSNLAYYYGINTSTVTPVLNPSFETGDPPSNWSCQDNKGGACNTFAGVSTPAAQSGTYSVKFTDSSAFTKAIIQQSITVEAYHPYTFTAYVQDDKTNEGTAMKVTTGSYGTGSTLCSVVDAAANQNVWTQLTCEIVTTGVNTTVYVVFESVTGFTNESYVDNIIVTDNSSGTEVTPSCTVPDGGGTTITCSGQNFSGESVAVSATEGIVVFQDKMYTISSVGTTTIVVGETVPCSTSPVCTESTTRIWKQGKSIMGREQIINTFNSISNSTADVIVIGSSKAVFYGINSDDWSKYDKERDFFRKAIADKLNLNGAGNCNRKIVWLTGDNHTVYYAEPSMLGDSSNCKEYELAASPIGASGYAGLITGSSIVRTIANQANFGMVTINTTPTTPTLAFNVRNGSNDEVLFTNDVVSYINRSTVLDSHYQIVAARDDSGYSFVAYRDTDTSFKIVRSEDDIGTFTIPPTASISKSSSNIGISQGGIPIVIDITNNKLYAIYGDSSGYDVLIQSASFTSGLSWDSNETTILNGTGTSDRYSPVAITMNSSGYLEIVASYYGGTNNDVLTVRATNANSLTTWDSPYYHATLVDNSPKFVSIDSLGSGKTAIVVLAAGNGYIYYNAQNGSAWTDYPAITWTSATNTTATANDLQKTGGVDGIWDADAISDTSYRISTFGAGRGMQFKCGQTNKQVMAGLSADDPDANFNTLDFAIHCRQDAKLEVYENGTSKYGASGTGAAYTASDIISLELNPSNKIVYKKNGAILYTSTVTPSYPLWVDTSLKNSNATINDVGLLSVLPTITTTAHTSNKYAPTISSDGQGNAGIVFKSASSPYPLQFSYYNGTSWDTPYNINNNEEGLSPIITYINNRWYTGHLTKNLIRIYSSSDSTPTASGDWALVNIGIGDTVGKYILKTVRAIDATLQLVFSRKLKGLNDTANAEVSITSFSVDLSSVVGVVPLYRRYIQEVWQ